MCNPIGSTLSNQFTGYAYDKTKQLDASTIRKGKDQKALEADLKTAISDGKISKEEYTLLKQKYVGNNPGKEKAFLETLNSGLGGKALNSLEKLANSQTKAVEFVF